MPIKIIHNDISTMASDIVVNATDSNFSHNGGVSQAIFKRAGQKELEAYCQKYKPLKTTTAILTPGFNLPATSIIHVAGPHYLDGKHHEKECLIKTYQNVLQLAVANQAQSISLPLISSGVLNYPKEEALNIAMDTIKDFLNNHELNVFIVVYDKKAISISKQLHYDIQHYIDKYFEDPRLMKSNSRYVKEYNADYLDINVINSVNTNNDIYNSIEDLIKDKEVDFATMLLSLIDKKGFKDVEVYKRANIDRKLFSKIKSKPNYHPKKNTVLSFAIALELNLDETVDLLKCAGYSLSNSQVFDIVIRYFIEQEQYDIFSINEVLFHYELPLLAT